MRDDIVDMFTAHCDSLTELNARGKNVKVSHKRRAHVFVALLHKPALGNLVPVCIKGYLQMTKVVTDVKEEAYQTILQVKHAYF